MALNIETFKTRATTAIVFVAIMLIGVLVNHWSFLLLFSIIHFGCWVEYQKLMGLINKEYKQIHNFHKYGVMLAGYGFMLFMLNQSFTILGVQLHAIGWFIIIIAAIALPIVEILFSKKPNPKMVAISFVGLVYISLSWGLLLHTRVMGLQYPLLIIASIWINDTMAYLVGSFIGKTPLSIISPKKTWEGTVGGAILAIAIIVGIGYAIFNIPIAICVAISSISAIMGTLGDLLESKLKRLAGVKDSGSFMPGHGGFLDRFDSLLIATPFVWLWLHFFK